MTEPASIEVTPRPTRRQQIEKILSRANEKGEKLRMRIPVNFYDYTGSRQYVPLRDAAWNIAFPVGAEAEDVETYIAAVGKCIEALAQEGCASVLAKLAQPAEGAEGQPQVEPETGEVGD